jgi:hypothetical protein
MHFRVLVVLCQSALVSKLSLARDTFERSVVRWRIVMLLHRAFATEGLITLFAYMLLAYSCSFSSSVLLECVFGGELFGAIIALVGHVGLVCHVGKLVRLVEIY